MIQYSTFHKGKILGKELIIKLHNCTIFFDNNDSGIGSVLSKEFLENGDLLISGNGGLTAPVTQFMVPDEHGNGVIDSRRHLSINAITDYSFRFIIYKNNQP